MLLAALALTLSSCHLSPQAEISLAIIDWPGYEYFYLAAEKKLDHQENLALTVHQFSSLADQRRAFVRGDVDAIATTLSEAIAICREAAMRCPVLVLVLDESDGADQLISSSNLTSLQQLRGKLLGLERSDLGHFIARRALNSAGLNLSDVKLVYGGPAELVNELTTGHLDAVVTYTPFSDPLTNRSQWNLLFSSKDLPGEIVDVLAVSPELFQQKDAVKALINTWWAARGFAQQHPTDSISLMAGRQKVTPMQFTQSEQGIHYPSQSDQAHLLSSEGPVATTLKTLLHDQQPTDRTHPHVPLPRVVNGSDP